jgi:hypothetical protein
MCLRRRFDVQDSDDVLCAKDMFIFYDGRPPPLAVSVTDTALYVRTSELPPPRRTGHNTCGRIHHSRRQVSDALSYNNCAGQPSSLLHRTKRHIELRYLICSPSPYFGNRVLSYSYIVSEGKVSSAICDAKPFTWALITRTPVRMPEAAVLISTRKSSKTCNVCSV